MNLANNLKKIRKEHNLSQEELAEKLNVSRQSVSKWESNQAYPEMDKMLQICQLFDLNMDDLLNQDIKEVKANKESKININNFIDSFLSYVTKTIDMFSNMKLKAKVKCVFEQLIIAISIIIVFYIAGIFLRDLLFSFLTVFSDPVSWRIMNFFRSIYLLICFVLALVLIFHIFKTRYLDYYEVMKVNNSNDDATADKIERKAESKAQKLENNNLTFPKERIVIRDPKHSGYKFIQSLVDIFLIQIKCVVGLIGILFSISLILEVFTFVVSFLFIKVGLAFIGVILGIIGIVIINIDFLILIYNFILSKKNHFRKLAISFLLSLFIMGIGIGLIAVGLTDFEYIQNNNSDYFVTTEEILNYFDGMMFDDYTEFIEADFDEIKVVIKHAKTMDISLERAGNYYYFNYAFMPHNNELGTIKQIIKDINNKKFINYDYYDIKVYTSSQNIEKLISNFNNCYYKKIC